MNSAIMQWAVRNRVSMQALEELKAIFGLDPNNLPSVSTNGEPHTEAYVQSLVRLEGARKGYKLWRNNVGVLIDETGRPVRYGLANDSPKLNAKVKSGDLIGWRPILITPQFVGTTIAQFVSRECKHPQWRYTGTESEIAQNKWAQAVMRDGGDATFVTGEGTL